MPQSGVGHQTEPGCHRAIKQYSAGCLSSPNFMGVTCLADTGRHKGFACCNLHPTHQPRFICTHHNPSVAMEHTSKDDSTSLGNATALQRVEPHGIANEAKQDRHHDEAPKPAHILLHLQCIMPAILQTFVPFPARTLPCNASLPAQTMICWLCACIVAKNMTATFRCVTVWCYSLDPCHGLSLLCFMAQWHHGGQM